MKTNIEIELEPFSTPNYVRTKKAGHKESLDDTCIHIRDLDSETLDKLCNDFRSKVFKKAGKVPPPEQA